MRWPSICAAVSASALVAVQPPPVVAQTALAPSPQSAHACPGNYDGDVGGQGVAAEERVSAEAELASALRRKGLEQFWSRKASFQIGRWKGIDRAHHIVVVQAFRHPDGVWTLERLVAREWPQNEPGNLRLAQGRLSDRDGRRLDVLLAEDCLYALPEVRPGDRPTTLCLDGQLVVVRFNRKDAARLVAQGCNSYGVLAEVESLVWNALPRL